MGTRIDLHTELMEFYLDVYFQPPPNIKMSYPCIVYTKTGRNRYFGNDVIYLAQQGYQITVIERDPDSPIPNRIEEHFQHCAINQHFTVDNLHHTTLQLYY